MSNPRYIKGRRKEWKIRRELLDQGFDIAQRSAGSHSPIDVFAIDRKTKTIMFIQSKPDGYKSKKYDEYEWLNDMFHVEFKVV